MSSVDTSSLQCQQYADEERLVANMIELTRQYGRSMEKGFGNHLQAFQNQSNDSAP